MGLNVAGTSCCQAKLKSLVQFNPLENTVPNIYR